MTPTSDTLNKRLQQAVSRGETDEAVRLISAGADINSQNEMGKTVIELAIESNDRIIANMLLEKPELDVNKGKNPPIFSCLYNPRLDLLKKILLRNDIDVNAKNYLGWTPLFSAVNSHEHLIPPELLNDSRTDVNKTSSYNSIRHGRFLSFTPLMLAAYHNNDYFVDVLLTHSEIDVNYTNEHGQSALSLAKENRNAEIMIKLVSHGASARAAFEAYLPPANGLAPSPNPAILSAIGEGAWTRRRAAVKSWAGVQAAKLAEESGGQGGGIRRRKAPTHKRKHRKHQSRRRRM